MRQTRGRSSSDARPLVGVVVDAASSYGRQILRGVLRFANLQRRWQLHVELRPRSETLFHWPACDGAIFAGGGPQFFDFVRSRSRHAIACSGAGDPTLSPVVSLDDQAAGALAAQHLLDCRLERFAFYTPASVAAHVAHQRLAGFKRIIEARGWQCIVSPVPFPSEVDRLTQVHWPPLIQWLRQLPRPIGIFAAEDGLAHDLAGACLAADVGVPDHVAIIGVNNDDLLCEGAWPPLSSIEADFTRVGYHAAMLLDRLLKGERLRDAERVVRLPPLGVVQRVSTSLLAVSEPALADAIRFIRQHACDPCSVADVLRDVPVGRRWLERQFVSQLGRTPHDEIIRVRIETARRLLLQPELSVRLVGERCGFSRVQFGRAFRQATGMTPATYRRRTLRGEVIATSASVAKRSELDAN